MPISWVRVDPQAELLARICVLQPTAFWSAQLEFSRYRSSQACGHTSDSEDCILASVPCVSVTHAFVVKTCKTWEVGEVSSPSVSLLPKHMEGPLCG